MARAWIGTSGWQYDHWDGRFYPGDVAKKDWLAYYCTQFDTVEINGTFYSLPKTETVAEWRDTAPEDFCFAFKASRYLTHFKRLKDAAEPVGNLRPIAEALDPKAGPMLVQLPPNWTANVERFADFLPELDGERRHAHEFRDASWFCDDIYGLLRERGHALVITDITGEPSPQVLTADYTYVRLHGPETAYEGRYPDDALDRWAETVSGWLGDGIDVYCYFDNDDKAQAPQDAQRLKDRLGL